MSIDKKDLNQIKEIVDQSIDRKLDEFAIMVGNGFQSVEERFSSVDQRFDIMDQKMEIMGKDIENIKSSTQSIRFEISAINQRLDNLEDITKRIFKAEGEDIQVAYEEIETLKKRITVIERKMLVQKK